MMDLFNYYISALKQNLSPILLDKPPNLTHLNDKGVLAINPISTLEVRGNVLYKDGIFSGPAKNIFKHLELNKTKSFFPAWLGFFSYEFAKHFYLPTSPFNSDFPDAYFQLFNEGIILDNQGIKKFGNFSLLPSKLVEDNFSAIKIVPSLSQGEFTKAVNTIKQNIIKGDVYQVNYALPFRFNFPNQSLISLYSLMRKNNPSPFMGIINHPKWSILSGSPERLFQHQNNLLSTRPIAGTKKRGESLADDQELVEELHASKKENAEHAMLVDLLRNDLNKVCKPSSVSVNEDKTTEFYSHVMHLVSNIAGNSNANFKDILQATFPGGTITGAPKFSVMKNIAELEKYPRGPYTGSMGYISSGAGSDFNILIRSVVAAKNYAQIHAGAGIVIDSDPISEWKEINYKSQFIRNILSTKSPKINQRSPLLNFIKSTQHKNSPRLKAKVFFLENNDSFSFNIIAALKSLGAAVTTSSNLNGVDLNNFSHLIIGPGPHCATKLPHLRVIIEKALLFKIPLLGICLGHQAIAHYFGSDITRAKHAAHGEAHEVFHNESKIFRGVKSPNIFARYHSLQIRIAPKDFYVDAWTNDDIIMAISHKYKNIYGVQFHPESYLSKNGQLILENFLSI